MEHLALPRHLHGRATWNPSTLNTRKGRPKATSCYQHRLARMGLRLEAGVRPILGLWWQRSAMADDQGLMSYHLWLAALGSFC
jgi:hypothetical protein